MAIRMSTSMLHSQAIAAILRNQSQLALTQNQMALGTKLITAGADPAAWAQAAGLDAQLAQVDRYRSNASVAQNKLGLEENALQGATDALNRIRELALESNNATQSADSRKALANEMRTRLQELLAAANSDDGQGRYLFAGTQDGSAPFSMNALGATYSGDQNVATVALGAERTVSLGDAGDFVFGKLTTGNGTFDVTTGVANTGAVRLQGGKVDDPSLWDGGTYTLGFSGGNYEVRDASNTLVTSGAYVDGAAIRFRGIELTPTGTPADGDTLTVAPSRQQDVFAAVQRLIANVDSSPADPAGRARQQTDFTGRLQEIDAALAHLSDVRGTVGNRLNAIDDALSQADAQEVQGKSALSGVRDLDYAEATGRLNLQMTALQAAQQSYVRIEGLSLFDYLR